MSDAVGGPPRAEEIRALVESVVTALVPEDPASRPADDGDPVRARAEGSSAIVDIALGADHGGYHLKECIGADLRERGLTVHDCGTNSTDSVDYPDFAHAVARLVADGACRWGIVVDGAGIGSAIAANKVPGIRAATCWDVSSARNSREHNHANVLALGAGFLGESLALQVVDAWLSTGWGGDRHARRVVKILAIEDSYVRRTYAGAPS